MGCLNHVLPPRNSRTWITSSSRSWTMPSLGIQTSPEIRDLLRKKLQETHLNRWQGQGQKKAAPRKGGSRTPPTSQAGKASSSYCWLSRLHRSCLQSRIGCIKFVLCSGRGRDDAAVSTTIDILGMVRRRRFVRGRRGGSSLLSSSRSRLSARTFSHRKPRLPPS